MANLGNSFIYLLFLPIIISFELLQNIEMCRYILKCELKQFDLMAFVICNMILVFQNIFCDKSCEMICFAVSAGRRDCAGRGRLDFSGEK